MASLSASEIQDQLKSLKEAARSRSPGELGRVDQVGKHKHIVPQVIELFCTHAYFPGVPGVHGPENSATC